MSGWIKMNVGLRRHPRVVRIASALHADRLRVVGALHAVWSIFDEHSVDGRLDGYTTDIMDEEIGWHGFSAAMQAVGWLVSDGGNLVAPSYEEHNGPVAKRRATDASRKALGRAEQAEPSPKDVTSGTGQMSASDADKVRSREEKNRSNTSPIPPSPKSKPKVSLGAWLAAESAEGRMPVPPDDPVFDYAGRVGIPAEFLHLAWLEFRHRYTQPNATQYVDWRAVFRKAIRGNWLKLWFHNPSANAYALTTAGVQAQRDHAEEVAA